MTLSATGPNNNWHYTFSFLVTRWKKISLHLMHGNSVGAVITLSQSIARQTREDITLTHHRYFIYFTYIFRWLWGRARRWGYTLIDCAIDQKKFEAASHYWVNRVSLCFHFGNLIHILTKSEYLTEYGFWLYRKPVYQRQQHTPARMKSVITPVISFHFRSPRFIARPQLRRSQPTKNFMRRPGCSKMPSLMYLYSSLYFSITGTLISSWLKLRWLIHWLLFAIEWSSFTAGGDILGVPLDGRSRYGDYIYEK